MKCGSIIDEALAVLHNFKSQSSTAKSWKAASVECIERKRKTVSSVEGFLSPLVIVARSHLLSEHADNIYIPHSRSM